MSYKYESDSERKLREFREKWNRRKMYLLDMWVGIMLVLMTALAAGILAMTISAIRMVSR